MKRTGAPVWLALVSLLVLASTAAAAQAAASATVTGVVHDASGAVVQAAAVHLRNHDTNQLLEATTDLSGRFRLLYVPVGTYHLSVDAPGFAPVTVNLALGIGQAIEVPVTLSPARVSEAVDVARRGADRRSGAHRTVRARHASRGGRAAAQRAQLPRSGTAGAERVAHQHSQQ